MKNQFSPEQIEQLIRQFENHGMLSAVKECRKMSDCTLLDAKHFIESLAVGEEVASADSNQHFDLEEMDQILDLIQSGKKLEAIKVHKESTRTTLLKSKEFIENLMHELEVEQPRSVPSGSGCSGVLWFAIAVLSGGVLTSLWMA